MDAFVHTTKGHQLRDSGRCDEALAEYRRAIEIDPDCVDAHSGLANLLGDLRRDQEAQTYFEEILRLAPDSAEAHFNYAMWLLRRGDFDRGWSEYEWRLKIKGWQVQHFRQPLWRGESLAGKTILLCCEQGLGDVIQFARYAPMVKGTGATVLLVAPQPLLHIARSFPGVDQLLSGHELPAFNYHCPLPSLPLLYGTTLRTIPANLPYLSADSGLVETWRLRLGAGFKIGIAWQGSPAYLADKRRSIPLREFRRLAQRARLICLQKGPGVEQIADCGFTVESFEIDSTPFTDTAAIMRCLDLVVTSDTSIAHLAGALGVNTWLALSTTSDWRWMLDRSDSPWYPTMRLFRQKTAGDWAGVFEEIGEALRELVGRQ